MKNNLICCFFLLMTTVVFREIVSAQESGSSQEFNPILDFYEPHRIEFIVPDKARRTLFCELLDKMRKSYVPKNKTWVKTTLSSIDEFLTESESQRNRALRQATIFGIPISLQVLGSKVVQIELQKDSPEFCQLVEDLTREVELEVANEVLKRGDISFKNAELLREKLEPLYRSKIDQKLSDSQRERLTELVFQKSISTKGVGVFRIPSTFLQEIELTGQQIKQVDEILGNGIPVAPKHTQEKFGRFFLLLNEKQKSIVLKYTGKPVIGWLPKFSGFTTN